MTTLQKTIALLAATAVPVFAQNQNQLIAHIDNPGSLDSLLAVLQGTDDPSPVTPQTAEERLLPLRGVSVGAAYTGEGVAGLAGGIARGSVYLDNADLTITLDADEAWGWEGATLFAYVLGNHGGCPSSRAGDVQVLSNIDAPDGWRVFEAWYEQKFMDNELSMRLGLYNLNAEFYVTDHSALFCNSSQGIGPEVAQSGRNGPSVFPNASLGARLRYEHGPLCLQTVVLDGVPGDPDCPDGTYIRLGKDDGVLVAVEAAWTIGASSGKLALGAWGYSSSFEDPARTDANGDPVMRRGSAGVYALAEHALWAPAQERQLWGFLRAGVANPMVLVGDLSLAGGLEFVGPCPGREEDRCGVAFASLHASERYRNTMHEEAITMQAWEVDIELTYRLHVTDWVSIQPDIQYIINPGFDPALDNALVAGARVRLELP